MIPAKPTRAELQQAYGRTVPDLVRHGLAVLLCGINPSLTSGALGLHFATSGNRIFLGLSAYRVATGERKAAVGPLDRTIGGARAWLLPNPSGLNASWQLPRLAQAYADLRRAVQGDVAR